MKIGIITGIYPPSVGGPATYSKLLHDKLPGKGISVSVLSFDSVRWLPKGIRHIVFMIKAIFFSLRHDMLYIQDTVSVGYPAYIATRLTRKKYMVRVPGDYAWEQGVARYGVTDSLDEFAHKKHERPVERLKEVQKKVLRHAVHIIVPSEYLKKITKAWGISDSNITVVYNAADSIDQKFIEMTKDEAQRKLNVKTANPTLFSVGRLVPWKGFLKLCDVVQGMISEFPDVHLYIAGSGPQKDEIQEKINELNMQKNITLLGGISKETLYTYAAASNVFVLNTNYEGLSHTLLEMVQLGLPIVTTSVGGNPEVSSENKMFHMVEYNDEKALRNKIIESIQEPKTIKKLQDHFDEHYMLDHVVSVIKKFI